jgi:hypothetical protein
MRDRLLHMLLEAGPSSRAGAGARGAGGSAVYRHLVLTVDPEGRTGEVLVVDGHDGQVAGRSRHRGRRWVTLHRRHIPRADHGIL